MKSHKITADRKVSTRRRYEDACGAAHALDLVGERWALLIMRELLLGPKRFSDLRADLPGISANVLTQRLEGLEAAAVLHRRRLEPPASGQVYELTRWGYESGPIFEALGRWAARSPTHDPTLPLSAVSLLLSFRTMFDPTRARGTKAKLGLRLGRESFTVDINGGEIVAVRGAIEDADTVLIGTPSAIAAAVYGGQDLHGLEDKGLLSIEGNRALAERFVTWFPLPAKLSI